MINWITLFIRLKQNVKSRENVDSEKIGIIGICGWGGMAINTAALDTRIKATVVSTMYDMTRVNANGYFDAENKELLTSNGLGYPLSVEGACKYWRKDLLIQKRLHPEIKSNTVIAWKRNIPYSIAVKKMIEEVMLLKHN